MWAAEKAELSELLAAEEASGAAATALQPLQQARAPERHLPARWTRPAGIRALARPAQTAHRVRAAAEGAAASTAGVVEVAVEAVEERVVRGG
jgi:hypothetical protein